MTSRRLKRPSSARRNIKQETFTPFVSGTRLRNIQRLLKGDDRKTKDNPDAILGISGIDSRYNEGMIELINYLLFGFFDVRKEELDKSGFEEEVIDDLMFLVQKDRVDVYCNPINYHYLLPYVSHWRNVFFHCMTDSEYEDEEAAEDFKISTFVNIVCNCQKVGIPYSGTGHIHPFDKFAVEKWPIIQAYAVEGIGGGGFFTMKHEVVDISKQVHKVYNLVDPVGLETIIIEQVGRLEKQWKTMVSTIDIDLSSGQNLTEEKASEALKSYYAHGRVGGGGDNNGNSKKPFVLFGTNTKKETMAKVLAGSKPSRTDLKSTAFGSHGANHMVCQAVSPRGPVSCARTYFFHKFIDPFSELKMADLLENKDLRNLIFLYSCMVDGVIEGINEYTATLSTQRASVCAIEKLFQSCSGVRDQTILKFLQNKPHVDFKIEAVDNCGCCHKLKEGARRMMLKTASMTLYDIPSSETSGSSAGSLVFSECFLDSLLLVRNEDGTDSINGEILLLTDHIPRFLSWASTDLEEEKKKMTDRLGADQLDKLGKLLMAGEPAYLANETSLCYPAEEIDLYAYQNGVVILRPNAGAIMIQGSHIKSASFYDGNSPSIVSLLILEYYVTFIPRLPYHLHNKKCQIVLAFTPKTKAYKHMFSEVLHEWKKESEVPSVKSLEQLPENCQKLHSVLQNRFRTNTSTRATTLNKASASLPSVYRFLDHFAASSVGWAPLPKTDLAATLNRQTIVGPENQTEETEHDEDAASDKVIVTILSGVPGSHHDKLCDVLSGLAQRHSRCTVVKQPIDSTLPFNFDDLLTTLKSTVLSQRQQREDDSSAGPSRVLYVTSGYTDIVDVVQAVTCNPDPVVRRNCKIGSITACVDPLNTFMEHRLTFPVLLNQCAQGWVNQILITSSTSVQNPELAEIQTLLRSVNSDVAFLLAEQGQITRSMDIDAVFSDNSFSQAEKIRARHLMCPGWLYGTHKTDTTCISQLQLKFSKPLEKTRLLNKLRALKASLCPFPLSGNIYCVQGRVRFLDSTDLYEVQYYTMSGYLDLHKVSDNSMETKHHKYFMTFTGCDLVEKAVKEWLRDTGPKKPEKKALVQRKDLNKEEIDKIHQKHHLDPLPEGWFFNGTHFVSFDGDKQTIHPCLEEFIKSYLEKKNQLIQEYNARVDSSADYGDLFT